jgi:hypothetical protein
MPRSPTPVLADLPPALRKLAEDLRALNESDRELVIAAARRERPLRSISWEELARTEGIAPVGGGDAVLDCDALYEDA